MALKDLIETALKETESESRRAALNEVLTSAGGSGEPELLASLSKKITDLETRAAKNIHAGLKEEAAVMKEDASALRAILRQVSDFSEAAPAPKKKRKAAPAPKPDVADGEKKKSAAGLQIGVVVAIVVVVAAAFGIWKWTSAPSDAGVNLANVGPQKIVIHPDDMTMGNKNAPIQMIEYAAPSCPHCAHFDETVFPYLKKNYIDTGKVFYVFRVFPIMPADAAVEAVARACFPADKYFDFIDLMFRNQDKWDPENGITDVRSGLLKVTRIAGLSPAEVDKCMSDPKAQKHVNKVSEEAVKKFDLHATPSFIINGELWRSGGVAWSELQEKLNEELAQKK